MPAGKGIRLLAAAAVVFALWFRLEYLAVSLVAMVHQYWRAQKDGRELQGR